MKTINEMRKEKVVVSHNINRGIYDNFRTTVRALNKVMSEELEKMMVDYIISHKAEVNEVYFNFINKVNDEK
jgi:hypothetical protein